MAARDRIETVDPTLEWLGLVPPTGLFVASSVLKRHGLVPQMQTQQDNEAVAALLAPADQRGPAIADFWPFLRDVLDWPTSEVAGAPGGPALPDTLDVLLAEQHTLLRPDLAVGLPGAPGRFQLLVRREAAGIDLDRRGALDGWEATPHQRFERLLRETGVGVGILAGDDELRLIHAPSGETSGWHRFPLRPLAAVSGRPLLGALKLLLGRFRLFSDAAERRLPALLRESREAQAAVSAALSEQVLGALHELLRGLAAAEPELVRTLAADRPHHLYEGLLTVLLRLIFLLYAEDRDLIPSHTDRAARALYDANYGVRGLHGRLADDQALNPDTMDERRGGWGGLLALFGLVHGGHASGWIRARGGKLFDPHAFPFLEGRMAAGQPRRVPAIGDGCIARVLDGLMMLGGERLSYRSLDVEHIGSVYETVMGFTVERATAPSLAIAAGKNNRTPVFVDLDRLLAEKGEGRLRHLKEATDRGQIGTKVAAAIKAARDLPALVAALAPLVDERGSPGGRVLPAGSALLQPTAERRASGSHYTPRSLTEPIVRQALAPVFDRLGADALPAQILALRICDPALGSGAFMVEACRQLGLRLVRAWARWPALRPAIPPDEDEELHARRLVAQRCLYGVDRNPMAVDLARLSLWLATLARDHEFTFLDHALKCGDSLVGLDREQIAALHWDPAAGERLLFAEFMRGRVDEASSARRDIHDAPDDVSLAEQEVRHQRAEKGIQAVRLLGDAVLACFFGAPKPKAREQARIELEMRAGGGAVQAMWRQAEALATGLRAGAHPVRPFHWPIEFPEVFGGDDPGFDAIVGNPPYGGKNTVISGNHAQYLPWLQTLHADAHGNADLSAHFFRRAFALLRRGGVFGLVATNTIAQGDTRASGLAVILRQGGTIVSAVRRLVWPGAAAVVVSVVHVIKGSCAEPLLNGHPVERVSAFLVAGNRDEAPARLVANRRRAFVGAYILGLGFTFDDEAAAKGKASSLAEMTALLARNSRNAEIVRPYLGGEELNNDPRQQHRRYVIDFGNRPLRRDKEAWTSLSDQQRAERYSRGIVSPDFEGGVAADWHDLLELVDRLVRPGRELQKRQVRRDRWWRFAERAPRLYRKTADLGHVLALSRISSQFALAQVRAGTVWAESLVIFAFDRLAPFAVLQSRVHEVWTRFFASSMKDDLRYTPSDCFETFPLPEHFASHPALEAAGSAYHEHRARLMVAAGEGLTRTYNRFHDRAETAPAIAELRALHAAMDRAVLEAYGWHDLAERAEAVFLDEAGESEHKYQGRLFWPEAFRDAVLARLLALNAERAAAQPPPGAGSGAADDDDEDEDGDGDDAAADEEEAG